MQRNKWLVKIGIDQETLEEEASFSISIVRTIFNCPGVGRCARSTEKEWREVAWYVGIGGDLGTTGRAALSTSSVLRFICHCPREEGFVTRRGNGTRRMSLFGGERIVTSIGCTHARTHGCVGLRHELRAYRRFAYSERRNSVKSCRDSRGVWVDA